MAPRFIERMRAANLPPEPPRENPNETARASWEQLRDYAAKILTLAHETDDANKVLTAEVESLRRENQRLADENIRISARERTTSAYAQNMRTRLTAIREQMQVAEHESLEYARHTPTVPQVETAEERADAAQMASKIAPGLPAPPAKINGMPENRWQ